MANVTTKTNTELLHRKSFKLLFFYLVNLFLVLSFQRIIRTHEKLVGAGPLSDEADEVEAGRGLVVARLHRRARGLHRPDAVVWGVIKQTVKSSDGKE